MHGLSGLGVFLLTRRFVSAPAALVGGMLYTFYPTRVEHPGHYYMLATGYLPLAVYFTERWLDEVRNRDAALITVTFGLQLL